MPMIDVYAAPGTFADTHRLAVDLARTLMTIEQVSVQVLTNAGALDRERQLLPVDGDRLAV